MLGFRAPGTAWSRRGSLAFGRPGRSRLQRVLHDREFPCIGRLQVRPCRVRLPIFVLLASALSCSPERASAPGSAHVETGSNGAHDAAPVSVVREDAGRVAVEDAGSRAGCAVYAREDVALVESAIERDFHRTDPTSKLSVTFGCREELANATLRVQIGNGHGGTLALYTFQSDGTSHRVDGISFRGYCDRGIPSTTVKPAQTQDAGASGNCGLSYTSGLLGEHLGSHRTAIAASISATVREETSRPEGGLGLSGTIGSSDVHRLFALHVPGQTGRDRVLRYSGYAGSDGQEARLPLEVAVSLAVGATSGIPTSRREATPLDREMFHDHLALALQGEPEWWVAERLFEMASTLGRASDVPLLDAWIARHPRGEARLLVAARRARASCSSRP
jgi:hypothetical protein